MTGGNPPSRDFFFARKKWLEQLQQMPVGNSTTWKFNTCDLGENFHNNLIDFTQFSHQFDRHCAIFTTV
jgi:hypothetical protein